MIFLYRVNINRELYLMCTDVLYVYIFYIYLYICRYICVHYHVNLWNVIVVFNNCDSGPCQNGGRCIDGIDDFTCMCTDSSSGYYAGKTCSEGKHVYTRVFRL